MDTPGRQNDSDRGPSGVAPDASPPKQTEAEIQREILLEYGSTPGLRIWRANTGAAQDRTGRVIRFGAVGQADIMGIRLPHGQLIAIEVKSASGRQSKAQHRWQRMLEAHGGLYILARSVSDVHNALRIQNGPA